MPRSPVVALSILFLAASSATAQTPRVPRHGGPLSPAESLAARAALREFRPEAPEGALTRAYKWKDINGSHQLADFRVPGHRPIECQLDDTGKPGPRWSCGGIVNEPPAPSQSAQPTEPDAAPADWLSSPIFGSALLVALIAAFSILRMRSKDRRAALATSPDAAAVTRAAEPPPVAIPLSRALTWAIALELVVVIALIAPQPELSVFLLVGPVSVTALWPPAGLILGMVFAIAAVLVPYYKGGARGAVALGVAALMWFADAQFEANMRTGGANIRLDLILIAPIAWTVTIWAVVTAAKQLRSVSSTQVAGVTALGICVVMAVLARVVERRAQDPSHDTSKIFFNPPNFRTAEMSFDADRDEYRGPCPVTVTFSGTIKTSGAPGYLAYRLSRSDASKDPVVLWHFDSMETKTVSTTWTVDRTGMSWQQFALERPQWGVFQVPFVIECASSTGGAQAKQPPASPTPGFDLIPGQPVASPRFHVVQVSLSPDREQAAGRCPVTVKVTGTARAKGGAGYVSYRLGADDKDPWQVWRFDSAGSRSASVAWTADTARANRGIRFEVSQGLNPPNYAGPYVVLDVPFTAVCDSLPRNR